MKKEKVKHLIKTAPTLIKAQLCRNGEYCILGYLLHFAGVPDTKLTTEVPEPDQYKILEERFGIGQGLANQMMSINDNARTLDQRRAKLVELVDELDTSDESPATID